MTSQRTWEKCKFKLLSKMAIVRDAWKRILTRPKLIELLCQEKLITYKFCTNMIFVILDITSISNKIRCIHGLSLHIIPHDKP